MTLTEISENEVIDQLPEWIIILKKLEKKDTS
jgi:hypothetical protein